MEKVHVRNFRRRELEAWIERIGERAFRARQIFHHLYVRYVTAWDQCTDLSKELRRKLEYGCTLNAISLVERLSSSDGSEKFLFSLHDGLAVEAVLIPDASRLTLCLSTQVGCPLRCSFCRTGSLGFRRNLTAGEIIDQFALVQSSLGSRRTITNIVFMGMGEPLLNEEEVFRAIDILLDPLGPDFSHRRITVSTAGIVPAMYRLGARTPVNLAVSLHAPRDDLRSVLMPINTTYPLSSLIETCERYPLPPRKRITFEYLLLAGVNDGDREAHELIELLRPLRCKLNLIPYNPHEGAPYRRPSDARIEAFQRILKDSRMTVTLRESRGADIAAACGQLAGKVEKSYQREGR